MKLLVPIFASISSLLLLLHSTMTLFDSSSYQFRNVAIGLFVLTLLVSILLLFNKQLAPLAIQLVTLAIVMLVPTEIQTDVNFTHHKEAREEIIAMLVDGTIEKKEGQPGFFEYPTPAGYEDAVRASTIRAAIHSDEEYFVFFQSTDNPALDFVGLQQGFIYSSTGEFPSPKQFDAYYGYKQIDEHWYFVSSDDQNLRESCRFVCGDVVYE